MAVVITSFSIIIDTLKASILLGSRGVDLPAMSSRIGSIQGDIIQAADTTPFTDIPGFLKGGKVPLLISSVADPRSGTFFNP
jgi:hypothetical protein